LVNLSVIIPNFNGEKYLPNCLKSLQEQTYRGYEIIVVDNGSSDRGIDILSEFENDCENLKVIRNTKNEGFAKAVNQGIKASAGDYVVLLNNDTETEPDWLLNLVRAIEENDKIFSVSSKMLRFQERDILDDAGDEFTILGWAYKRGDGQPQSRYASKSEVFSSCAGAAIYRKRIFTEIGLFDEKFFAYLEDIDIGYRARIYGYTNWYCPQSVVYHVGSATSGSKYNPFKVRISARNNIYLIFKNMPWPQLLINSPFLVMGFLIKSIFFFHKGFGKEYLEGLREGLANRVKLQKIGRRFTSLSNYLRLEGLLIMNLWKYIQQKLAETLR
jgi:GT2 family glycosyltransferase